MGAPIGNQNAKKDRLFRAVTVQQLEADPELLPRIVLAMLMKAADGDVAAFRELRDTVDGKPKQQVSVDGDGEGGPVLLKAMVELVKP